MQADRIDDATIEADKITFGTVTVSDSKPEDMALTYHFVTDDSGAMKQIVRVEAGGRVQINWAGVEAALERPEVSEFYKGQFRLLIAVRDGTWQPLD